LFCMWWRCVTFFGDHKYEWLAMPMGLRNSLPIHQRDMTAAL